MFATISSSILRKLDGFQLTAVQIKIPSSFVHIDRNLSMTKKVIDYFKDLTLFFKPLHDQGANVTAEINHENYTEITCLQHPLFNKKSLTLHPSFNSQFK